MQLIGNYWHFVIFNDISNYFKDSNSTINNNMAKWIKYIWKTNETNINQIWEL